MNVFSKDNLIAVNKNYKVLDYIFVANFAVFLFIFFYLFFHSACIHSHLNYSLIIWGATPVLYLLKLCRIQNKASRVITGTAVGKKFTTTLRLTKKSIIKQIYKLFI